MSDEPAKGSWKPIAELGEPAPGTDPIRTIRVTETWRWLPYKPAGQRQMKRRGRWQKWTGYGFENAELPEDAEVWQPDAEEPGLKPYQP